MKRGFLILSIVFFNAVSSKAQMIDNKIFSIIKEEGYDKAISYGNKKLAALEGSPKYYKKATPYHLGLGMVYRKMGNYAEAEKYYYEAEKILHYKEKNNIKRKIIDYDVFDERALMYLESGNFYQAEDLIKAGIKEREKRFSETNLLRYRSYLVYGNYFFKTGQPDSAYAYFKKYIFYIKNSRHTSKEELNRYADTYQLLAQMELERKNATQALIFARKAKHLQFHKWTKKEAGKNNLNKIISLNLLSSAYRLIGDQEKAVQFSAKAFAHYNKVVKTESYHLVPLLMNRGFINWDKADYSEAEKDFVRASRIQSEFIDKNFRSLSEYEKENFYSSLKKNFDVLNSFAVDMTLNNSPRKDSIWPVIYDFHIKTKAIILNESNRMMEVVLSSKDQELLDQFKEWRKLKNQLAQEVVVAGLNEDDPEVRKLNYSINDLEKQMSKKTALFTEKSKDPSWLDVKNKLKPGQAAVEVIRVKLYGETSLHNTNYKKYRKASSKTNALTDSVAYLFIMLKPEQKNPEVLLIKEGNLLEQKHYKFYHNTKLYKLEDTKSYDRFWKPLGDKLQGSTNIYFSSDGVYNLVNLWILKNPVSGKYLIDEWKITNVTNTRQLLSSRENKLDVGSVLLLGRPNYSKSDVPKTKDSTSSGERMRDVQFFRGGVNDLPGTETEVKSISDYLKKNRIDNKILLWDEATEEILKGSDSRHVMHIATHGFFDSDGQGRNPMLRSGLLLAGIKGAKNRDSEDGILTAYEASNLDLSNTNLVVLSACETGLGEVKDGEGVYGLQRAFEVAGVDAILMSMWKVNDQTTQELMVAFYEELLLHKSVIESFRKAQLKIRNKYPEPLYWGAFKLIGE